MERLERLEVRRAGLRAIVAAVDREIAKLRATAPAGGDERPGGDPALSRAELADALALGSAPELRKCPLCHGVGMRAATRCGSCWTKLPPLPPPGVGEGRPA